MSYLNIQGLQKLTLLDYPNHTACTIFLGACDLCCPFCHNAPLIQPTSSGTITPSELFEFLKKRQGLLDGVCISGGEPLLHADLDTLLTEIRNMGYLIKLDTNGTHPDHLNSLLSKSLLDYVAMDIKNSPSKYAQTVGKASFNPAPITESIHILHSASISFEFRTTVVQEFHEISDFVQIGQWIQGAPYYYIQSFVDRNGVPTSNLHPYDKETLLQYADTVRPYVKHVELRGI